MALGYKPYLSWRGAFDERRDRCNIVRRHDERVWAYDYCKGCIGASNGANPWTRRVGRRGTVVEVPYKATAQQRNLGPYDDIDTSRLLLITTKRISHRYSDMNIESRYGVS